LAEDGCRADVWLWRARLVKTRGLAAQLVEAGRVRLTRPGLGTRRLDKPSREVKAGDELVFAIGDRLTCIRVLGLGARRGPPLEARALYQALDEPSAGA